MGVTTRVTNYDSAYTWAVTAASGQASIDGSGVVTVTGLSSGQGTSVTVTTNRTDYESGSASASGQAMVEIPDATAPVAPKLTQVVRKGSKAKVTWVAQSFGGSAITNATATCKAGSWKLTASGTAATLTVKKLKSGKKYTCSVTVENIWGSSPCFQQDQDQGEVGRPFRRRPTAHFPCPANPAGSANTGNAPRRWDLLECTRAFDRQHLEVA